MSGEVNGIPISSFKSGKTFELTDETGRKRKVLLNIFPKAEQKFRKFISLFYNDNGNDTFDKNEQAKFCKEQEKFIEDGKIENEEFLSMSIIKLNEEINKDTEDINRAIDEICRNDKGKYSMGDISLITTLLADSSVPEIIKKAVEALGDIAVKNPNLVKRIVPLLIKKLSCEDKYVADAIINSLIKIGEPALQILREAAEKGDKFAQEALRQIEEKQKR